MALVEGNRWSDERRMRSRDEFWADRDSFWNDDRWMHDWQDWPTDWPQPRELVKRFRSNFDRRGFLDWPSDWPNMDAVVPRFSSHLDRLDRNWRSDPFWKELYPRWAEPIFKEGIDIKSKIVNDMDRFAVDVDAYQFRPEEIQVKTVDDTLLIEGRHEDVRDRDNFTKMYFVRKYQLPSDVDPADISSAIDDTGRLTVEAQKRYRAVPARERMIPIEGPSRRGESRTSRSSDSPRDRYEADRYSPRGQPSPQNRSQSSSYYQHTKSASNNPPTSNEPYREQRVGSRHDSGDYLASDRQEHEYRSESKSEYRSESRQDSGYRQDNGYHHEPPPPQQKYRVDSPASTAYSQPSPGRHNGNYPSSNGGLLKTADSAGKPGETRSESVRSVQILRKTFH